MTLEQFLFSFTFVFGIIYLLSHTSLFTKSLDTFLDALVYSKLNPFLSLMGYYIFYISLFYQVLFWAKFFKIV